MTKAPAACHAAAGLSHEGRGVDGIRCTDPHGAEEPSAGPKLRAADEASAGCSVSGQAVDSTSWEAVIPALSEVAQRNTVEASATHDPGVTSSPDQ